MEYGRNSNIDSYRDAQDLYCPLPARNSHSAAWKPDALFWQLQSRYMPAPLRFDSVCKRRMFLPKRRDANLDSNALRRLVSSDRCPISMWFALAIPVPGFLRPRILSPTT